MFLHPLWLAGLLALAVPLALHLWSRRPGRVIRVGSTRHLTGLPPVRRIAPRLTEPLLLTLRLGVLAAVVLALAEPRLPLPRRSAGAVVVLVAPEVAGDSLAWLADPALDSLRRVGADIRLLAPGFPDYRTATTPTTESGEQRAIWDLLAEADRRLPSAAGFVVVAPPRPGDIGERRPALTRPVTWHEPARPAPRWSVVSAWREPATERVELLLSEGDSASRRLLRLTVPARGGVHSEAGVPAVELVPSAAGGMRVRLLGADAERGLVQVATVSPLRVAVTDSAADRARRLLLAAEVLGEASGRTVVRAASADSADLVLSSAPGRGGLRVPGTWVPLASLPDSLLEEWPAPVAPRPVSDPRRVGMRQALPAQVSGRELARTESQSIRPPLLWLGIALLMAERWLAFRSRRRTA